MKLAVRRRSTLTAVAAAVVLTVIPAGAALATGADAEGGNHHPKTTTTTTTSSSSTTTTTSSTTTTTTSAPTTTTTTAPATTTTTSTSSEPTSTTSTTSVTVPPVDELPDFTECPDAETLEIFTHLTDKQWKQLEAELEAELNSLDLAGRAAFFGLTVEEYTAIGFDKLSAAQLTDLLIGTIQACLPVEETPSFTG